MYSQWDRFLKLKSESKKGNVLIAEVGVRRKGNGAWVEVGEVACRSDSSSMSQAVSKQKRLIAEHSLRISPGELKKEHNLEWGFRTGGDDEWAIADTTSKEGDEGCEKFIGFEGIPDPNTGYFCSYDNGRVREGKVVCVCVYFFLLRTGHFP